MLVNEFKMAKKKSKPEKKVSAEELGPTAFTSQEDYEEQVKVEAKAAEEKPEDK